MSSPSSLLAHKAARRGHEEKSGRPSARTRTPADAVENAIVHKPTSSLATVEGHPIQSPTDDESKDGIAGGEGNIGGGDDGG